MPWFIPWSESIKKRACRYLLQRYLGQFFEEKLTLDQLSVDLYNGKGTVAEISLDVQALNELGEQQNWPMEFVDGYVEEMSIAVPWSTLLKDSSNIEVRGLNITIQPKQRSDNVTSMFESMWSSMTSSMQLAQECLKQDSQNSADNDQRLEGIERFAQTIDSILCRVKVKFINTVIRLEHVPKDCNNGVAIQINIQNMEYLDEAGNDPPAGQATELTPQDHNKAYVVSSFTIKKFYLEGVQFFTDEFPSRARTFSRSVMSQSQMSATYESSREDEFLNRIIEDESPKSKEHKKSMPENDCYMSCTDLDDQETAMIAEDKRRLSVDEHEPILFGKLSGRQEVRLKLKQSEEGKGPKVSIDLTMGSFTVFLSPRQMHVLLELAEGISSPHLEDTRNVELNPFLPLFSNRGRSCNVPQRQRCSEKPMGDLDFQRVEQELQQQLNPLVGLQTTGLQNTQGWSTAPLDCEENDIDFLPMRNASLSESVMSTGSSMASSISSSISSASSRNSTQIPIKSKRRSSNNIDLDPTAEITHFQIRLASLAIVLLHEDLLSVSSGRDHLLVPSSVTQMKHTAETFFSNLGLFAVTGYGNKDFEKAKNVFEKACELNHIRLLAAPIQIEGDEKITPTSNSIAGNIMVAKLELLECLWNAGQKTVEYVQLLTFLEDNVTTATPINTKSSLKVVFKYSERAIKSGRHKISYPKMDILINLDNSMIEFDITIIDRICALLNPQPVCAKAPTPVNQTEGLCSLNTTDLVPLYEYHYDFKIHSPYLNVKLRFPIPDFRPVHDMQRVPWWKRNVRSDFLTFIFTDATFQSSIHSKQPSLKYELQCRTLDLHYTEADTNIPLHIGRASIDDKQGFSIDGFNWPRIVMEVYPVSKSPLLMEEGGIESENENGLYSMDAFGSQNKRSPSPFSAKRIVHESDTPHTKPHQEDTEELIIPGDRQEMTQFIDHAINSSQIRLDLFLPSVSLQLVSKHIYELLYNRINTDLLLWEASAPKQAAKQTFGFDGANLGCDLQESIYPKFMMCKSGIQYESESESEEEADVENEGFFSLYESRNSRYNKRPNQPVDCAQGQSFLSLNMHIAQGVLNMHTPARDTSTNVIPEQHGEFLLLVDNASIFTVSQFMGNTDLSYVCVQARTATLHHCDVTATPSQSPPLREIGSALPRHLHPTIYKSEAGVIVNSTNRSGDRDMLSVAVRIQASHETHHVKTIRVAVGINKATLRHRMCVEPNSWFSHMVDFFDVLDYPIPGYMPMGVLTELHLHLWDCAIDYRPLYLPVRSVLTMGSFSMSSHLTAQANTSTLRFIAEDCGLFLSDRAPPKGGHHSLAPVDLRKDYVCVLDLSLFELSLRLNDKIRGMNPHVDLRASNNILHIRTCSDTGRALMQLITYFAGDGDLDAQLQVPSSCSDYGGGVGGVGGTGGGGIGSTHSTPRKQTLLVVPEGEQLLSVSDQPPQDISNLSKSQHQHVNDLLGEAMKESLALNALGNNTITQQNQNQEWESTQLTGVDVFFFPDENQPLTKTNKTSGSSSSSSVPVKKPGTIGPVLQSNRSSDTDEEFCFVGDEAGLGIMPKSGLPEIRWLTEDSVRIIDNHFSVPIGKTDLLKPPKHFPTAVLRYTLCEMTLVWHMYGGYDFKSSKKDHENDHKKTVNFSDLTNNHENLSGGVKYSKNTPGQVNFTTKPDKKLQNISWQAKGGVARDHGVLMELQLNKVRFQHEVYPNDTVQASRQVLLISEVEIRDRLASSEVNKFLYQHTSQARPKQSHANMIVIKLTHIRPDPKLSAQECCLRVSLLPLRLNIDQDSLLFLITFFNELSGNVHKMDEEGNTVAAAASRHATPTHQPPVMTVSVENEAEVKEQAQKLVSDNLLILLEEENDRQCEDKITKTIQSGNEDSPPIYFRNVIFSPSVPIRLDYVGKRVDMSHGPLAGLLMGLGQLNCSELTLKRLSHRHGLLGFDKLFSFVLQEWLQDIKKHQLPSIFGGIGPMHSFVQLFQGIRDLFWLPIEQYQKDGRLVRGLQRGANSFTTSTAMAALELTSKIIHLIQATAETAYDMVSPGPSVRRRSKGHKGRRRHTQPQDIREGMANAYMVVKEGIGETANTIVRAASHEHEQKGYSGAVGGVLRQIPPTFVKPIIIASEATNNLLEGMRSQIVPDASREAKAKWRTDDV